MKKELNICSEMKSKLESQQNSTEYQDINVNSIKENYETTLTKRNKDLKKFENDIFDLSKSVQNFMKIELMLKQELIKKDNEVSNSNEILKIYQKDNEKIMDEIIQLKKDLLCLNNNSTKEFNESKIYKESLSTLKNEKKKINIKFKKNNQIVKNKTEQNNAMINLLKVMKQQIALLQNFLIQNNHYTSDLSTNLKELKNEEHKVLHYIQQIAVEQNSESEIEMEGI